jgi:hypothetical protein
MLSFESVARFPLAALPLVNLMCNSSRPEQKGYKTKKLR